MKLMGGQRKEKVMENEDKTVKEMKKTEKE